METERLTNQSTSVFKEELYFVKKLCEFVKKFWYTFTYGCFGKKLSEFGKKVIYYVNILNQKTLTV